MAEPPPRTQEQDTLPGFLYAATAYLLWGFLPLYMKALAAVPPVEVVAHRVLWSVPVAGLILLATGRRNDLRAALRSPRMLAMAALTAALVSANWGIYVWAIGAGRAVDTALGYYINPLFSVLLGALLLGERLQRGQIAAVAMAALAVAVLTVEAGLPWVALALAGTFGLYGFFRKTLPIGPNQGFFLEVLLLAPFALAYLLWTGPAGHFGAAARETWLLAASGLVTAIPLMLYANGAKGLRLSTIGMMQYTAPTVIFLIAVFVFREPFDTARAVAFGLIWTALLTYTVSSFRARRRAG
jgi:chloramphenicol-sensitive protein RarD